jgi:DNA-binding XRE family transcriptional regulator
MGLGARIEARRKEIGISQAELARRVGVRQSTMNSLINGNSRTTRSIVELARELSTTPHYLMGLSDDPDEDAPPPPPPPPPRVMLEVTLPPTSALQKMFEGLLAGLDPQTMTQGELALQLAELLPIGLSQLRDLRFVTATLPLPIEASAEADAALAIDDRGSRP